MKAKTTRRALLMSALSLLLCVSMLVGTTFAWFTDSVTSAGNIIQSGNLDIAVQYTLDGENWADLAGADDLFQKSLWEPGHTEVVALKIENKGNLALKYVANMNIVNEVIGMNKEGGAIVLSDILTVSTLTFADAGVDPVFGINIAERTIEEAFKNENGIAYGAAVSFKNGNVLGNNEKLLPGEIQYVAIKVDMAETVGNEANHNGIDAPSIEFGINVFATQYTYEKDSFGNQYDKDAEYDFGYDVWDGTVDTTWYNETDTEFTLDTAEALAGFAQLANAGNTFSGKTIVLDNDMDLDGAQWTPIKKFSGTLDGDGHTIGNFSIDATSSRVGFFAALSWAEVKNLTLTDIDATVGNRFGVLTYSVDQTTIEDVTVSNVNITTTSAGCLASGLFCAGTVNSTETVKNCTVENITVDARKGAALIGGIATFVQRNGTEAEGTNVFENLQVKNFKVIANDTDGQCAVGGIFAQTQSVWQNPHFKNCSVSGLDVVATGTVDVGGFICYPGSWTYATNCTTEGKIDVSGVTSAKNYAGGFFGDYGWGDNISKGDHKVTDCVADVDVITNVATAGGFIGSGINTEKKNKNITLTNCEAKGTVTCVEGGTAVIGGFVGNTDRGIYVNCSAAQAPFIGAVNDGYTLNDDGNGTLSVAKN